MISFFRQSNRSDLGRFILVLLAAGICPSARAIESTLSIRPGQEPELTIAGEIGSTNRVEFTDALGGVTDWKILTTVVLHTSTDILLDHSTPARQSRFYRVFTQTAEGTNAPFASPEAMVWIIPGSFVMGSPEGDPDLSDLETPQSNVTLTKGFWIGEYEVTQARYQEVTGVNPSAAYGDPNRPVDSVTWNDAVNYCALLNDKERMSGKLPSGYAYRLPTEAEWEYSARAGKLSRFSYGNDLGYLGSNTYAWTDQNSPDGTQAVGQKSANGWGIFDIYGNVFEWCRDWLSLYTREDKTDPEGPATGNDRIYRGGSWANTPQDSRAAARGGLDPSSRLPSLGFRVVLAPE